MELQIFSDYKYKVAESTGPTDLEIDVPEEVGLLELHQVAAMDKTSAPAKVYLGLKVGLTYHWFASAASPAAGTVTHIQGRIYASGGTKIVVRFADATTGDELWLFANGLTYWKKGE